MADNTTENVANLIELAGEITIAWLQNPNVNPGAQDVPSFLKDMHAAITGLGEAKTGEPEAVTYQPAVSPRSSIKPDHLVSLIDGKKYKTLKRHLAQNDLTPDQYRARYGLKSDYPMVAPEYAAQRREIAKTLGLGRKRTVPTEAAAAPESAPEAVSKPAKAATKTRKAAPKAKADAASQVGPPAATPAEKPVPAKRKRAAKSVPAAAASGSQES